MSCLFFHSINCHVVALCYASVLLTCVGWEHFGVRNMDENNKLNLTKNCGMRMYHSDDYYVWSQKCYVVDKCSISVVTTLEFLTWMEYLENSDT